MTKAERNELLSAAVVKLDEAAKLLRQGREELLSQQVNDLADLIYVLTTNEEAA
jgi:hypothetical protein